MYRATVAPPITAGDYRGPDGIWTEAVAQGKVVGEPDAAGETPWDEAFYRLLPAARPTFTHLAITALMQPSAGRAHPLVRHVITQNEDALHRRAGVVAEQLSELHGNAFVEVCHKCGPAETKPLRYERSYAVFHETLDSVGSETFPPSAGCASGCADRYRDRCHCTARSCDGCGGKLAHSIVHFGESLNQAIRTRPQL